MAGPDWALLVLVVYPLAQIPLVVVLARRLKLEGGGPTVTPTMAYWTQTEPDARLQSPVSDRPGRCGRCGTDNDPAFTFCGGCLARL